MGADFSLQDLPDKLTLEEFREVAEDKFDLGLFETYKDADDTISYETLQRLNQLTDCFLTHDWGKDELGRDNHQRVLKINAYLKNRGLITWFDSDRMIGEIVAQM